MKRIAAIIATAFVLLAIPATAMASTGGPGIGGGNSSAGNPGGQVFGKCPLPQRGHHHGSAHGHGQSGGQSGSRRAGHGAGSRHGCRRPQRPQPVQVCTSGTVTFSMSPSSRYFSQSSGPELYVGENFGYDGTTYTIATVSGAVFSLVADGSQYVNSALSVPDASATATCTSSLIGS